LASYSIDSARRRFLMANRLGNFVKSLFLPALVLLAVRVGAASLTNNAAFDTSLLEVAPSNNNGGQEFVIAGAIQNPPISPLRARALFQFDLTTLPTNTRIQTVVLELAVTKDPGDGLANAAAGLHRMLRPWGEGNKVGVAHPGQGEAATAGEATWSHSFYPTNAWTSPGAEEGVDFVSSESSSQDVYSEGSLCRFPSTPALVADVQSWVNDPQSNFGWILISYGEGTQFTARHFGSREDPAAHPNLEIQYFQYLVPPRIESARQMGDQFELQFTAEAGQTYVLEYRAALTNGIWQTLTNLGLFTATSSVSVRDDLSEPHRFYRLNSY
jgi:hypothetical protein